MVLKNERNRKSKYLQIPLLNISRDIRTKVLESRRVKKKIEALLSPLACIPSPTAIYPSTRVQWLHVNPLRRRSLGIDKLGQIRPHRYAHIFWLISYLSDGTGEWVVKNVIGAVVTTLTLLARDVRCHAMELGRSSSKHKWGYL